MYDENRVVVKIWPNRLVKGPVSKNEYEALVYVATHTSVPVPKVHRIYDRSDGLYIEREFVDGKGLDAIWNTLAIDEKRQYIEQVWGQLETLRKCTLPPSIGYIAAASIAGGPVEDGIFSPVESTGPYSDLDDFHNLLRRTPNRLALPSGKQRPTW